MVFGENLGIVKLTKLDCDPWIQKGGFSYPFLRSSISNKDVAWNV